MTTRNFPTGDYRADPNAPQPYYDSGIYNLPNHEHVPTSFAVGSGLNPPGVGLSPTGYTQNPGTYLDYDHRNPSLVATSYGNAYGTGYGHGYGYNSAYTPGYTSSAYNGLFLKQEEDVNKSGKLTTGALAGIIAGGVCLLGLCIGGACCVFRNNKYQNENGDVEMN